MKKMLLSLYFTSLWAMSFCLLGADEIIKVDDNADAKAHALKMLDQELAEIVENEHEDEFKAAIDENVARAKTVVDSYNQDPNNLSGAKMQKFMQAFAALKNLEEAMPDQGYPQEAIDFMLTNYINPLREWEKLFEDVLKEKYDQGEAKKIAADQARAAADEAKRKEIIQDQAQLALEEQIVLIPNAKAEKKSEIMNAVSNEILQATENFKGAVERIAKKLADKTYASADNQAFANDVSGAAKGFELQMQSVASSSFRQFADFLKTQGNVAANKKLQEEQEFMHEIESVTQAASNEMHFCAKQLTAQKAKNDLAAELTKGLIAGKKAREKQNDEYRQKWEELNKDEPSDFMRKMGAVGDILGRFSKKMGAMAVDTTKTYLTYAAEEKIAEGILGAGGAMSRGIGHAGRAIKSGAQSAGKAISSGAAKVKDAYGKWRNPSSAA